MVGILREGTMAQQTVLVIEEDITWQKLLKRILGGAAYNVYIAATCAEGIKLTELYKPDCIVLDFHLPDGDALSVCSAIRLNKSIKTPPVIIFSSDPDAEAIAYTECQANSFVLKGPESLETLPATVSSMLAPVCRP